MQERACWRSASTSLVQPDRSDAIAGKPAPTRLPPATTNPCRSELAREPLASRSLRQTAVMPSLASQLPQDPPATTNSCRSELARDPLAPRSFIQTAVMSSLASQLPQDLPTTTNPCRSELARDPLAPRSFIQTAEMPSLASQLPQDYRQPPQTPVGASLLAIRWHLARSARPQRCHRWQASSHKIRQPVQIPVGAGLPAIPRPRDLADRPLCCHHGHSGPRQGGQAGAEDLPRNPPSASVSRF